MSTDLRTELGGFAASLDADTGGVEGATYVWTPAELIEVLGQQDGEWAARTWAVSESGTFEADASVLQLREEPMDVERWSRVRQALLARRAKRAQPARDDKVIAGWNGLAIAALAEAGASLGRPDWIDLARDAADFLLDRHLVGGRLIRSSLDGRIGDAGGVLSDYADLADGLLALYQATGDTRWSAAAGQLLDTATAHFSDGAGSWYDTADDADPLVVRPRDPTDGATPSGAAALADALMQRAAILGSAADRLAAETALRSAGGIAFGHPRAAGRWLSTAEALHTGPLQVVIAGESGPLRDRLAAVARSAAPGGSIIEVGDSDAPGRPLLADRPARGGTPVAYVCRGFVCDRPVTDEDALRELLHRVSGISAAG